LLGNQRFSIAAGKIRLRDRQHRLPGQDIEDAGNDADPKAKAEGRPERNDPAQIPVPMPLDCQNDRAKRDQHDQIAKNGAVRGRRLPVHGNGQAE